MYHTKRQSKKRKISLSEVTYRVLLKQLGKTWNDIQDDFDNAFFDKDAVAIGKVKMFISKHVALQVEMKNGYIRISEYHPPLVSGDLYINPYTKRLSMVE